MPPVEEVRDAAQPPRGRLLPRLLPPRELVALLTLIGGLAALTVASYMVDPVAGVYTLGGALVALGLLLGFGPS